MYDVASGRLVASTRGPRVGRLGANALDLSPDGSTLAVVVRARVHLYDARTLTSSGPALDAHTGPVHDVEYSHDGKLLATASDEDHVAIVWDARTGEQLHAYPAEGPLAVAFSSDDRTLFTTGGAGLLQAWDLPGASHVLALGEDGGVVEREYALSLPSPDGNTVARVRSGRLWFADTETGRRVAAPVATRDVTFLWSPDARWLLSLGEDSVLTVWDASTGAPLARSAPFEAGYGDLTLAFGSDPDQVHVHDRTSLYTLNRESLRPAYPSTPVGSDARALALHPVDGSVFVLDEDGSFIRVDPKTGIVLDSTPSDLLFAEDTEAVMSPDGTRMVVPGPGRRVRLLDVQQHTYLGPDSGIPYVTSPGSSPQFAPDGSQFALVQADRIRLWDGRTGEYQASLPLPSGTGAFSIAYRPDSAGLVIASTDGRTWTADTRTEAWVGARLRDRQPEPLAGGVGAVLPEPALRTDLPAVAGWDVTAMAIRAPAQLTSTAKTTTFSS